MLEQENPVAVRVVGKEDGARSEGQGTLLPLPVRTVMGSVRGIGGSSSVASGSSVYHWMREVYDKAGLRPT